MISKEVEGIGRVRLQRAWSNAEGLNLNLWRLMSGNWCDRSAQPHGRAVHPLQVAARGGDARQVPSGSPETRATLPPPGRHEPLWIQSLIKVLERGRSTSPLSA
jgi:hypothetical protein